MGGQEKPDQIIFDKETKESRPKNSHLLLREKNPGKRDRELSKQRWNFQTSQLLRFPLNQKILNQLVVMSQTKCLSQIYHKSYHKDTHTMNEPTFPKK